VNDQHVTAIATIVQDALLLLSAVLIFWYLRETRKMRKAAQDQVEESQELVKAAQRQIDVGQKQVAASKSQADAAFAQLAAIREQIILAQDQLEGQIRPALVARVNRQGVELVNIGSGPALHVRLSPVNKGSGALLAVHPFPERHDAIAFLESKQNQQTIVQCRTNPQYSGAPVLDGRSLQCTYKSLSGRIHYTVVDFTDDRVDDTRFYEHEPE